MPKAKGLTQLALEVEPGRPSETSVLWTPFSGGIHIWLGEFSHVIHAQMPKKKAQLTINLVYGFSG